MWHGEFERNICNKTGLCGPSYPHQHPAAPTRRSSRKPLLSTHPRDHPLSIQGQDHGYFPSGYTTSPVSLAIVSFSTEGKHPANNPNNEPAGQFSARVSQYISVASDTLTSPSFWVDLSSVGSEEGHPILSPPPAPLTGRCFLMSCFRSTISDTDQKSINRFTYLKRSVNINCQS